MGDIAGYIAQDNPQADLEFGQALIQKAKSLANQPMRGREILLGDGSTVRQILHNPYRILYDVDEKARVVNVLRFWHGARGEPELTDEG